MTLESSFYIYLKKQKRVGHAGICHAVRCAHIHHHEIVLFIFLKATTTGILYEPVKTWNEKSYVCI